MYTYDLELQERSKSRVEHCCFYKYITCFWTIKQGQLNSWKLLFHKLLLFPKSRWSDWTAIVNLWLASVSRPLPSHVLFPELELGKRQDFPLVDFFVSFYLPLPYCSFFRRGASKDLFMGKGAFSCVGQPTLQSFLKSGYLKNQNIKTGIWGKQNQRIASFGCFKNLKESLTFVKEPPVHQFFNFFFLGQSQGISEGREQQFCYVVKFCYFEKRIKRKKLKSMFFLL